LHADGKVSIITGTAVLGEPWKKRKGFGRGFRGVRPVISSSYEHADGAPAGAGSVALHANVLVLNKFYQAIRVVNVRRAFSLLCRDMAEVIHIEAGREGISRWQNLNFESWQELSQAKAQFEPDEYEWIHTVRFQIAVPRIIRLLAYDKLPRQDVKFNRRNIYARDSNRCQYCGRKFSTSELSLDHVIPKSQGGKTSWENIVCCCIRCNVKKGGRTPEQASIKLITKPVKPKRSPVISIRLADQRYWSWKQFLDEAYWSVELK
jgi:5-methylcytosine-specific restriction endonuclease McrA